MELKQVIQWLLDNQYGVVVNNQFVLTQKLNKELFNTEVPQVVPLQVSTPVLTQLANPDEKKVIWNQFIERASIPHRVKATDGGTYTVRQYSPSAVNKLIQIVKSPDIDYDKLIASTKHYYASVSYKVLLSKYLLLDIWKDEYQNYKPGGPINLGDGSRWED